MIMITMKTAAVLSLFLSSPIVVGALDLEITSVTCDDETYPTIAATMAMTCNNGADTSCTMGESVTLSGTLTYNGIDNFSVVNNVICLSGSLYPGENMKAYAYEFSTNEMGLCDESYIIANDGGENDGGDECPADGTYEYAKTYTLPDPSVLTSSSYFEENDFMLTGFNPYVEITFDDCSGNGNDNGNDNTLGFCAITFYSTSSTASAESAPIMAMWTGRSALILIIVAAAISLVTCFCCWRRCRRGDSSSGGEDDKVSETEFTRMDDDTPTVSVTPPREEDEVPKTSPSGPGWTSI